MIEATYTEPLNFSEVSIFFGIGRVIMRRGEP